MNNKYERQMKKGVYEIVVLKLLSEDKKYGYCQMEQAIE